MFEVIRAHQVALAKRQKKWAVIEAPLADSNADALDAVDKVGSLSQREREVLTGVAGGLPETDCVQPGDQYPHGQGARRARILRRLGVRTMEVGKTVDPSPALNESKASLAGGFFGTAATKGPELGIRRT